ncbi:MAG: TauD/TfdA family dioxygenase [Sphingomonadaceae bacterium]
MPEDTQPATLDIVRVAGNIGAEIRGVRLAGDLDDSTIAGIRQALLDHKVVFFRGQQHLTDTEQEAFAERFGELQKHPMAKVAGGSEGLLELTEGYSASTWHTDLTFMPDPAAFAVLRAMELPSYGGDTMWANCAKGYERLPAPLRALADSLWAIHSTDFDFDGHFTPEYRAKMPDYGAGTKKHVVNTEHPVVQLHPETGERSLILGSWLKRFVGLTNADTAKLYELFQGYLTAPENCVRWSWQKGDVAMWDNRATQHRAVPDYPDEPRILRRATVLGTVPTAIDGTKSRMLAAG